MAYVPHDPATCATCIRLARETAMSYPFRQAAHDLGLARGPRDGFLVHMAEGGGTVGFLSKPNRDGVSVHYVIEYTGRIVQMLLESHMHSSIRTTAIRLTDDPDGFYGRTAAKAVLGSWADTRITLGPNHATIAVEIEGFAAAGPNAAQHGSLRTLVNDVRSRFPTMGLLGHRDFQDYKACPGKLIHWDDLGGHGTGDTMGLHVTYPGPQLVTGMVAIPKGTDAIRVADGVHYTVPLAASRPATRAALTGPNSGSGYVVDLNGDEWHFVREAGVTFVLTPTTGCTDQQLADARSAGRESFRKDVVALP